MEKVRSQLVIRTFGSALVLALSAASVVAQVPKQRRLHARMLELRLVLQDACFGKDETVWRSVAARVMDRGLDPPLQNLAVALGAARGVDATGDYSRFWNGLMPLVLPSVVSQDGGPTSLYATLHLPRVVDGANVELAWVDVEMTPFDGGLDTQGDTHGRVFETIEEPLGREDLLRFSVTKRLDTTALEPGRYTVSLRPAFHSDERPKIPSAFPLEAPVWIIPGYRQRAARFVANGPDGLRQALTESGVGLERVSLGELTGAVRALAGVWVGEPRLPGVDPALDLRFAEGMFEALQQERDPLAELGEGLSVDVGVPFGVELPSGNVVGARINAGALVSDPEAKPLVVVMPASPTWDRRSVRPSNPRFVDAAFGFAQLVRGGLLAGDESPVHLVVIDSPGGVRGSGAVFRVVTERVLQSVPVAVTKDGRRRICWVGEREGAYQLTLALGTISKELVDTICLVDGGSVGSRFQEQVGDRDVLLVGTSDPGGVARLEGVARLAREAGVEIVDAIQRGPWPAVLGLSAVRIRQLACGGR